MRTILLCALLTQASMAEFVRLESGKQAKASEVNGNFEYLSSRLDSLVKALGTKDSAIQRLSATRWSDTVSALRAEIVRLDTTRQIPKGTIAAFLSEPESDGYLPNSAKSWILAAGQADVNGVKIPDLRGQFLRGVDYIVTGRAATGLDPDGTRKAGTTQNDAFQGHWHQNFRGSEKYSVLWRSGNGAGTGGGLAAGTTQNDVNSFGSITITTPVADTVNGTPRTDSETRPKNVAVYWYVKVK
ncbi:MAG TPA: hypothetical protein PKO15_07195 [Fibrobacteria bacterium]|nr:hypothetical protein [Fibrobacteria bacterium]HOX50286.1 hypothetical protein [Fibrobacteria bacterium]